jgi:hypothetical protein
MNALRPLSALLASALLGVACQSVLTPPPSGSSGTGGGTSSATSAGNGGAGASGEGGAEPFVPYCNRGPSNLLCNPYGLSLERAAMSEGVYWDLLDEVFDVHFYRPEPIQLDLFEKDPTSCASCEAAVAEGYYLVLVLRDGLDPLAPTPPPQDLAEYRAKVGKVIDHFKGSLATVVIEREAESPARYAGTPEQYLAQLAAACEVAHQKGARCTDSGVGSTSLLFWLARYYAQNGNPGEALRILRTAENNPEVPALFKEGSATVADLPAFFAAQQERIDRSETLLAGHRAAGVDAQNFHWYEPSETTLDEIIAILRARTGCFRLVTDEIGQRSDVPLETEFKLVLTKELGLPLVVWSSRDDQGSRSLVSEDGALRPTGDTFAKVSNAVICGD